MNWSPKNYYDVAVIAQTAAEEMSARLDWMLFIPKIIIDLGCGLGEMSSHLQKRYPQSSVIALDISEPMLSHAHRQNPNLLCICGDSLKLPFADQSIDMLFANLLLPWQSSVEKLFKECSRVLHTEGLFVFSALGLDTLKEWRDQIVPAGIPLLLDMHDIGDALINHEFIDPVLDVDHYTTVHSDYNKLIYELCFSGMIQSSADILNPLPPCDKTWSTTYELIYAHAFKRAATSENLNEIKIPLSQLREQITGTK